MANGLGSDAGRRVARMWRSVRWGAALFCLVQFVTYTPPSGTEPPVALLPLGTAISAVVAALNAAAWWFERRVPRREDGDGPQRRDAVLLAADALIVATLVWLFTFDPQTALWPLLVLPLLQAGLVGGLRWSLRAWAGCLGVLLAAEVVGARAYGRAADLVGSFGYRAGVLLLVAAVVGVQASVTRDYLRQLHAVRRQLLHQATHDALTGVAGRALFLDRATRALRTHRERGGTVGVLFVDCDRFKAVNDVHGHAAGDAVLCEVARRLAGSVRPQDTVARLGGDEFAVLLEQLADGEVEAVARRVRAALHRPYLLPGSDTPVDLRCSIGVTVDQDAAESLPQLLHRADTAMYAHKARTRTPVSA